MNVSNKIYEWVESKIGDKVDLEIEQSFLSRNKINIESFVQLLIDNDFSEKDIAKFRTKLQAEMGYEAYYSIDDLGDTLLANSLDLTSLSLKEKSGAAIEKDVHQLLLSFEFLSPDEVICLPTWPNTRKTLEDVILHSEERKTAIFGLQILRRLVTSNNSPKAVCEGFIILAENIIHQIEAINSRANRVEAEELYEISGGKPVRRSSHRRRLDPPAENNAIEILTRSLHILLAAQKEMPGSWLRFSEKKLIEIISSFLHMLSVSFPMEMRNVSGFDLITVLQPRGTWCRHWCHGSLGRGLLCQEFRKNRRFFHAVVDTVITSIPVMKQLHTLSPPAKVSDEEEPMAVIGVPVQTLYCARFCHCFSMVTYLIQYRAGRALFPIQTASRRRPWTAQDIVGLMVEYVIHVDRHNQAYKPSYVHHMIELGKVLLTVEGEISSARGLQKRSYR